METDPLKKEISITKLRFEAPALFLKKPADFSQDYLLPLEVAIHEATMLSDVLDEFQIDIQTLVKNGGRRIDNFAQRPAYQLQKSALAEQLKKLMDSFPHLHNAFTQIMENINTCLTKAEATYCELSTSEDPYLQETLADLNELYDKVDWDKPEAIEYLREAGQHQVRTEKIQIKSHLFWTVQK